MVASLLGNSFRLEGDRFIIFSNTIAHLGFLGGVAAFNLAPPGRFALGNFSAVQALRSGLITFLVSLPFVTLTALAWTGLLTLCGLPVENQLAIDLFGRTSSRSPWVFLLGFTAVVIAPFAEEMIFRAGIFRFVRTRLPRWAALLFRLPFRRDASQSGHLRATRRSRHHLRARLRRTGDMVTAIVAHAAFNLNMVVLLLAGVSK